MAGASSPRQLALNLDHSESFAREDFLQGASNQSALTLVESWPDWPDRIMAVVGPAGAGKSHLASIWAAQSGARFVSARALHAAYLPASLATGALVVEDVADGAADERALFHLLNLAREENAWLLFTARQAPAQWTIVLPDLASRLRALPAVSLSAPDDALLRALIVKLFADRQLAVDENLIGYLVGRIERSFAGARAAVDALDREALRRKRPVNRALAAELYRDSKP
jgi:chromosomal replication initiation ATPase DnaA